MGTFTRLVGPTLICVVLLASSIAPILADTAAVKTKATHKAAAVKWPQTCPVSGNKIASAKDAADTAVYKGKTYYFCCPMCKPLFIKDPAKYVAAAAKGHYLSPM
jgi:YHS domain-containing protein